MLTKRWRSRSSSLVSTKPDIRLHPGTTFLLTASQARLLSWQNFWQKTQGWWITLGTMMRTIPRTKMLEASDIFIVCRWQQRGSDTRSWSALHGQVPLFLYLSYFCFLVYFCLWNQAENLVRPTVLENILNDLFHVFRYETCSNLRQVKRHLISSHPHLFTSVIINCQDKTHMKTTLHRHLTSCC